MSGPRENGDWGFVHDELGLWTLDSGDTGDRGVVGAGVGDPGLMKGGCMGPFCPNDTLCGMLGSGTCW